jgi:hypothetical protein
MDADSWAEREVKFRRKFETGRKYIHSLFKGVEPLPEIDPIVLLVMGSAKDHPFVGGAKVQMIGDLLQEIRESIPHDVKATIVPEQFVILRTLQFAAEYWEKADREKASKAKKEASGLRTKV